MDGATVEIDRAALLGEAAAIAAELPAESPAAPGESPAADSAPQLDPLDKAAGVAPSMRLLVANGALMLAPGWDITRAESDAVGDSLAAVMAHWMPDDAIAPKYMALFTLAFSLGGVVWARRDPDTGKLLPMRKATARADRSSNGADAPAERPAMQL